MMAVSEMTPAMAKIVEALAGKTLSVKEISQATKMGATRIYPALLKLGKSGWVCSGLETRTDHRAPRRLYGLTACAAVVAKSRAPA